MSGTPVLRDPALARRRHAPAGAASWRASRRILRRLLLGAHVSHVCGGDRKCRLDARARRDHGDRKEHAVGPQTERAAGYRLARVGSTDRARPFVVVAGMTESAPARPLRILPVIVLSRFAGTSLW